MASQQQINAAVPISSLPESDVPQADWLLPAIGYDSVAGIYRPYKVRVDSLSALSVETVVDNIAALQGLTAVNRDVWVRSYTDLGDLGGGRFRFDPTSTATPDDGTVFTSNHTPTGRWLRYVPIAGEFVAEWFGARGDNLDASIAINNAAITAARIAAGNDSTLILGYGHFKVSTTVFDYLGGAGFKIRGPSAANSAFPQSAVIVYTAATGTLLSVDGSEGFELSNIALKYNNPAYNGDLVDLRQRTVGQGLTASIHFHDFMVSGTDSVAVNANSLIRVGNTLKVHIHDGFLQFALRGLHSDGTLPVNDVNVHDNWWQSLSFQPLTMSGNNWHIHDNAVEPLTNGNAGWIVSTAPCLACEINSNNIGDANELGTWIDLTGGPFFGGRIGPNVCSTGLHSVNLGASRNVKLYGYFDLISTTGPIVASGALNCDINAYAVTAGTATPIAIFSGSPPARSTYWDGADYHITGSGIILEAAAAINFGGSTSIQTGVANMAFAGATVGGYHFDFTVYPSTNDAGALGTPVFSWSDLFLASGGVINWNNGDVLVTHSANTLAFTGASVGYTFDAPLTATVLNGSGTGITGLATSNFAANVIDTDGTLTANSDTRIATQKAVKTLVNALIGANDVEAYKGVIDCSANPNYPAADAGHVYRVSVAGKIGGVSGVNVEVNDRLQCIVDGTVSGNQATVGAAWWITQANIDGAVVGPASAVDATPTVFDGATGKLIKNITFAAFKTALALVKGDVGLGNVANVDQTNASNLTSGTVPAARTPSLGTGALSGLVLSAAGATATFGVAVGIAVDSTAADWMKLASAYTKTTAAWVVGTGNGALDTGAIAASTWYHVYLIKRVDTGVVDVLVSLSATAPTLPTNYTLFRRLGSMKTDGSSQWIKFIQEGDLFTWDVPVKDVNAVGLSSTAAILQALSTPLGVNVIAKFHARVYGNASVSVTETLFSDPNITDTTPDLVNSQQIGNINLSPFAQLQIRTNTSSQIRYRVTLGSGANTDCFVVIVTEGWLDTRGK